MLYLLVVVTLQTLISWPRGQGVNMRDGLVILIKELLSQRSQQQQHWRQHTQKHREKEVWFRMCVVTSPLALLVQFHCEIVEAFESRGGLRMISSPFRDGYMIH